MVNERPVDTSLIVMQRNGKVYIGHGDVGFFGISANTARDTARLLLAAADEIEGSPVAHVWMVER